MRDRDHGFRPALLQGQKRFEGSGLVLAPSSCVVPRVPAHTSERARFHAAAVNEPPDEPA